MQPYARSVTLVLVGLALGLLCLLLWDDVIGPALGVEPGGTSDDVEAARRVLDERRELDALRRRAKLRGLPGAEFNAGVGVLRGEVFRHVPDGEPQPLPGVEVLVLGHDGKREYRYSPETDAEGRFEVLGIRALFGYLVSVHPAPFKEKRLIGVSVLQDRVKDVGRILLGAPTTLTGEVRTAEGGPPRGAVVQVFPDRSRPDSFDLRRGLFELQAAFDPIGESAVDPTGRFAIRDLPPGRYLLRVAAPGYATAFRSGIVVTLSEESSDPRIVLDRGAGFTGRIKDEDGRGVAGARLLAVVIPGGRAVRVDRVDAASGPDGSYRLDTLTPGVRYFVEVGAEGFAPFGQFVVVPEGVADKDFELLSSGRVEGRVTDAETGHGIAEAEVTMVAGSFARMSPVSTITDAGGFYVLPRVSSGPVLVFSVAAAGFQQSDAMDLGSVNDLQVVAGEATVVDWALDRGGSVSGVVRSSDGAVPYATVALVDRERRWVGERTALTAADGSYRIDGLRPTQYELRVTAPGFAPVTDDQAARVDVADVRAPVTKDVLLVRGGTVSGQVRGPDGGPLAGAQVFVEAIEQNAQAARVRDLVGLSDLAGRYSIVGVPPLVNVRLVVQHDAYVKATSAPLRLAPGEQREVALALRPGVRVDGHVSDHAGRPVADARIRWGNVEGVSERDLRDAFRADEHLGPRVVRTANDGAFVLEGIEPGLTLVKVEKEGHAPWYRRDLRVAAEGAQPLLPVELEGALAIAGRVVSDGSGVPLSEAVVYCQERAPSGDVTPDPGRVNALVSTTTGSDGRYLLEGVPPGRYEVVVWFAAGYVAAAQDWRHEPSRRQDVEAGTKGVDFRLVTKSELAADPPR